MIYHRKVTRKCFKGKQMYEFYEAISHLVGGDPFISIDKHYIYIYLPCKGAVQMMQEG